MSEYVGVPYIKGSDTSKAAAKGVKGENQRERAWNFINSRGDRGATAQEVNEALGIDHGCCTRVTELVRLGRIKRLDKTRKTSRGYPAKIHIAVPKVDWADKRPGWPAPKSERSSLAQELKEVKKDRDEWMTLAKGYYELYMELKEDTGGD
jgi:hypothetical protein